MRAVRQQREHVTCLGKSPATRPVCLQKRQVTRYSKLFALLSDRLPFAGLDHIGVAEVLRRFGGQPFGSRDLPTLTGFKREP